MLFFIGKLFNFCTGICVCVGLKFYFFVRFIFCFNFVLYWAWYLICCCTRSKSCWTCYVFYTLFFFCCGIIFYISMFLSKFTRSFKWSSECLNAKCLYMFTLFYTFFLCFNTHTHTHTLSFENPWPNLGFCFNNIIMFICIFNVHNTSKLHC